MSAALHPFDLPRTPDPIRRADRLASSSVRRSVGVGAGATERPRPDLRTVSTVTGAGFDVVLHEGAHRAARVVPGADRLCVVVSDQGSSMPLADDSPVAPPGTSTTVWMHRDGSLSVRASWGPPALLVRGERVLMLPEVPGTTGQTVLQPGERLVVLSSAAYEYAPQEIVRLLHEDPPGLARAEAGDLLGVLLGRVPDGGGAVITRCAGVLVPTGGGTR